jgi:hypothetical protein
MTKHRDPTAYIVGAGADRWVRYMEVRCPHRARIHTHSYGLGPRVAHCSGGRGLGYWLAWPPKDPTTETEREATP